MKLHIELIKEVRDDCMIIRSLTDIHGWVSCCRRLKINHNQLNERCRKIQEQKSYSEKIDKCNVVFYHEISENKQEHKEELFEKIRCGELVSVLTLVLAGVDVKIAMQYGH